jgi:hypothetical protein
VSVFPHPGYPIAAPTLRPVLSVGLPGSFVRLADDFPLVADLDERIWGYVDLGVAAHLAGLVISRAQQMRDAPFWKLTRFPRLKRELQLEDLAIEEATAVCLRSTRGRLFVSDASGLAQYSLDHIVSILGVRPTVDLLAVLSFHTVEASDSDESYRLSRTDLQDLIRHPHAWPSYSQKFFPVLSKAWSLADLSLSVRAYNCLATLIRRTVINDVADLSRLKVNEIMELPNFGVVSLVTLLEAIDPLVLDALAAPTPVSRVVVPNCPTAEAFSEVANRLHSPQTLFGRHFPEIPVTTDIDDMGLDVRTYNCIVALINDGVISKPSDLSKLTLQDMMRTHNFGRKSLINLLRAMERLVGAEPMSHLEPESQLSKPLCVDLTREAERLAGSRIAGLLRCNDIRLSHDLRFLVYSANNCQSHVPIASTVTLQQLAQRLTVRTTDPPNAPKVVDAICRVRLRLAEVVKMDLESELCSLASVNLHDRNLDIILALWGWTGDVPKTLQSVGESVGITRERVRQIAARVDRVYRRRTAYLPALQRVLGRTAQAVPVVADEIERKLQARGLTAHRFRIESVIACAKRFGQPVPFVIEESNGVRVVTEANNTGLTRLITIHARRYASKYGLVNIADLKEALDQAVRSIIDMNMVNHVICAMESYEDLGKGWFWLSNATRNHMLTVVRKVLAVAPRIHLSEMRAAIANDPRGMGFAPPKEVVLRFCKSAAHCSVEEDFLVAQLPDDPAHVLSDVEQVLFEELRTKGPLLSRAELEEMCTARRINKITLGVYLGRLPIVAKYGPGIYGLRGATFSRGDLNRVARPRQNLYVDHGWTESADPWAAIRLSPSTLSNGVVQLPSSLREQMKGAFVLKTEDGTQIGRLVVSDKATWGLSPLFRRRGGEPGDILLLTFDLRRREVTARLGDLAILPEPASLAEEIVS